MGHAVQDGERYRVNVLDRAVAILKAFDLSHPSLTLSEVAVRAKLHTSTCLRLLTTLRHHGMVSRDEGSGRYCLGYEILALAEVARVHLPAPAPFTFHGSWVAEGDDDAHDGAE